MRMPLSAPVDGFRLAYDRAGDGPPAVLLHGWPGWRADYRDVVPLLAPHADVVVPDLRGFGESDRHVPPAAEAYTAAAQAASVLALIEELGLDRPVLVGYDVGSRIARLIAAERPDAIRALVLAPPMPGIGERILSAEAQREFWYQPFHNLADRRRAPRRPAGRDPRLPAPLLGALERARLVTARRALRRARRPVRAARARSRPASPGTARAPAAWRPRWRSARRIPRTASRVPTTVLWGEHEPLFPPAVVGPDRASSSPTSSCRSSRASATSRRWRRRQPSPRLRSGVYAGDEDRLAGHAGVDHVAARPPARQPRPRRLPRARPRSASRPRAAPRPRPAARCARSARAPGSPAPRPRRGDPAGRDRELDRHARLLLVARAARLVLRVLRRRRVGGGRRRRRPWASRSASRSPRPRRRGRRRRRGGRLLVAAAAAQGGGGEQRRSATGGQSATSCRSRRAPRGRAARRPRTRPSCACA